MSFVFCQFGGGGLLGGVVCGVVVFFSCLVGVFCMFGVSFSMVVVSLVVSFGGILVQLFSDSKLIVYLLCDLRVGCLNFCWALSTPILWEG